MSVIFVCITTLTIQEEQGYAVVTRHGTLGGICTKSSRHTLPVEGGSLAAPDPMRQCTTEQVCNHEKAFPPLFGGGPALQAGFFRKKEKISVWLDNPFFI